ncbi:MAG: hypothetical protein J1F20_06715 [Muribaculaceae bacterium]|nr:hypothetical protein [Muribaculaceae bacterium]
MKNLFLSLTAGISIVALSSCGGSSSSSDGMFGSIPQTIEKYDQEKQALTAGLSESNYKKNLAKIEELKTETESKLEKDGEALNGKELSVSVDENVLKIETPLTLVYKNVFSNMSAVEFGLDGKIVAAKDLKMEINPSDLKGREMFGGKTTVVTAKQPVQIEFLDSEGNVVDARTIGNFIADNNGEEAIIKAGTAVDLSICSIPVNTKFANVSSARLTVDFTKGLTSETMPE